MGSKRNRAKKARRPKKAKAKAKPAAISPPSDTDTLLDKVVVDAMVHSPCGRFVAICVMEKGPDSGSEEVIVAVLKIFDVECRTVCRRAAEVLGVRDPISTRVYLAWTSYNLLLESPEYDSATHAGLGTIAWAVDRVLPVDESLAVFSVWCEAPSAQSDKVDRYPRPTVLHLVRDHSLNSASSCTALAWSNIASPRMCRRLTNGHFFCVRLFLASASSSGSICIRGAEETYRHEGFEFVRHREVVWQSESISSLVWSPDNALLLVATSGTTNSGVCRVALLDATRDLLATIWDRELPHADDFLAAAWLPVATVDRKQLDAFLAAKVSEHGVFKEAIEKKKTFDKLPLPATMLILAYNSGDEDGYDTLLCLVDPADGKIVNGRLCGNTRPACGASAASFVPDPKTGQTLFAFASAGHVMTESALQDCFQKPAIETRQLFRLSFFFVRNVWSFNSCRPLLAFADPNTMRLGLETVCRWSDRTHVHFSRHFRRTVFLLMCVRQRLAAHLKPSTALLPYLPMELWLEIFAHLQALTSSSKRK